MKPLKLPSPVLKNSKIKAFLEDLESKFKKNKNYKITNLDKQVEKCTDFRKAKKRSIMGKMNSLRKSLLKMKGPDDLKDYTRNKLIVDTVSKLRNSVELCKDNSLTNEKLDEIRQNYKHSFIIKDRIKRRLGGRLLSFDNTDNRDLNNDLADFRMGKVENSFKKRRETYDVKKPQGLVYKKSNIKFVK